MKILSDSLKLVYYLGTDNLNLFWSCLFYGYLGVMILVLLDVTSRDPKTPYSPPQFSWKYFWTDNAPRFVLNMILVFVCIRFLPEIFNKPLTQFYALLIGIGSDLLAARVKAEKDKMMSEVNDKDNSEKELTLTTTTTLAA